jgi:hypothetical protein
MPAGDPTIAKEGASVAMQRVARLDGGQLRGRCGFGQGVFTPIFINTQKSRVPISGIAPPH